MNRRIFFKVGAQTLASSVVGLYGAKVFANEYDVLVQSGAVSIESLQFVREEEKLARDVYLGLYKKWGTGVFNNIAGSEQTHTNKVRDLLVKYNLEDPAADTKIGEFINPTIQGYYSALMARGGESQLEALYVGAYIEELDIGDLRHEIDIANTSDVKQVYNNLMLGSYNHLQSFVGQIQRRGIKYQAQLLEQSDVDKIIAGGGGQGRR